MRVMVFAQAGDSGELGAEPTQEQLDAFAAMDKFTEDLVAAGIFVAAAGLKNDATSKRLVLDGRGGAEVLDGPFTESKEVVVGFSIWNVKDMDEALAWAKKSPMPGHMEIRPFYEVEDLAPFLSAEDLANAKRDGDRGKLGVA